MFSFNLTGINNIYKILDTEKIAFIIIALICSVPVVKIIRQKIKNKIRTPITEGQEIVITKKQMVTDTIEYLALTTIFLISIMYMTGSSYNPFIYFRF